MNGVLTVTAWRGDRRDRLWTLTLGGGGSTHFYGAATNTNAVAYVDRDRCADLVVNERSVSVVVSGRTGLPLWSLGRDGAAGVVRPAVRAAHRYVAPRC